MPLSIDCPADRATILAAIDHAPSTRILARDLDYFWDIGEIHIAGLAHLGALSFEPGVDSSGRANGQQYDANLDLQGVYFGGGLRF